MTSQAQIDANRRNALRSTGPVTPRGRAISAQNARKHAMRSEREKLGRDESINFESQQIRWAANYAPETDPEEFLLHANLFVASEMERTERAYLECAQSYVDKAEYDEIDAVHDTGNRLFFDPRGTPVALYGTRPFDPEKLGTSGSSEPAPALDPAKLVRDLASSAMGCYFILGVLEDLMERARERFWVAGDRLRMIRLLGRQPADCVLDRRVAEIFAASYALRRVGEHAFVDLQSDMNAGALERYVKDVRAFWPDLTPKDDPEHGRQSLIDLVQSEMDRIWAIAAEYEQKAGDEAAQTRARRAYVNTPEAQGMLRSFYRSKGSLERGIAAFRKEKRARKADDDAQNTGQVPGKDISPYDYDGRPHSWWRERVGGAENGGRSAGGNEGQLVAGSSGAAAEIGREVQADGTRSVPATPGRRDRGWESVVVEESDVLACQGLLPERCTGMAGDIEPGAALADEVAKPEAGSSASEEGGFCENGPNAGGDARLMQEEQGVDGRGPVEEVVEGGEGGSTLDDDGLAPCGGRRRRLPGRELPPPPPFGGSSPTTGEVGAGRNEPNFCDDVCIAQHEDVIEVPANSGGFSGLDNFKTNPIFLQTKPVPADGTEAGGSGGVDDRTDQPDRTDSIADAQPEREALKARRWQRFVRMQAARWDGARERTVRWTQGRRAAGRRGLWWRNRWCRRTGAWAVSWGRGGSKRISGSAATSLAPHPPWPPLCKGGKGGRGAFACTRRVDRITGVCRRSPPLAPPLQGGERRRPPLQGGKGGRGASACTGRSARVFAHRKECTDRHDDDLGRHDDRGGQDEGRMARR